MYSASDAAVPSQLCLIIDAKQQTCGFLIRFDDDQPLHDQLLEKLDGRTEFNMFEFLIYHKETGIKEEVKPNMKAVDFGYESCDLFMILANPLATFEVEEVALKLTMRLFRAYGQTMVGMICKDRSLDPDQHDVVTLYDTLVPRYQLLSTCYTGGYHHIKLKQKEEEEEEPEEPDAGKIELIMFYYADYRCSATHRYTVERGTKLVDFLNERLKEMNGFKHLLVHYTETVEIDEDTIVEQLTPAVVIAIPVINVLVKFGRRRHRIDDRYMFVNSALNILISACTEFEINYEEHRLLFEGMGVMANWNLYDFATENKHELVFTIEKL